MFNYDYKNVEPYLSMGIKENNRDMIRTFVFIITLFGIFPYVLYLFEQADTFKIALACISGFIVAIMDVWGVYLGVTFDKHEREYSLYVGVASQAMSIIFGGIAIEYEYIASHNKISILFIIMVMCSYVITIFATMYFMIKSLKSGHFTKSMKIKHPKLLLLIPAAVVVGLIIGKIAIQMLNYDATVMTVSILGLLISWPYAIGVHNIYKYMLIRHFESYEKPRKARGEMKKEKKLVIIKKGTKTSKGNVFKWYNMPIKVLKSFAGWKVKEKAPISASILFYFETSIITYVVLLLICFYRMIIGLISKNGFMTRFRMAVVPAFAIAFMADVGVLILLKIVEPFFNKPLNKNVIIRRIIIIIGLIIAAVVFNTPFITDYIDAVGGLLISLMMFWGLGICTIENFNDRTKKLRRNTKIITDRSPKEYIEYAMGAIMTIAGFFLILVFSFHIILVIYNTVEYNKGNFIEHEFKISSVKFGYGKHSAWIRSVKAINVNTGEEVNFKCCLETDSLMRGKIYDIKYIPFSNRIIDVKHKIPLTLGVKWMKFK